LKPSITLLAACALLISFDTAAQEAPLHARLRFASPAGCGNATDFGARVKRRAPRIRFGTRGTAASVSVRIEAKSSGLSAAVTLTSGGRQLAQRQIEAETCEDALDALALVVAVTLEEQDSRRRKPQRPRLTTSAPRASVSEAKPSEPAATSSDGDATPSDAEPSGSATPPAANDAPAPEPPPEQKPPPEAAPAQEPPEPAPAVVVDQPPSAGAAASPAAWRAGAGAGAMLNFGAAPSALPGWFVYGRFGWQLAPPWSPEIIISYTSLQRDGFDETSGSAEFRLQAANVELCPARWHLGPVDWMPCALFVYGRLKVRGYDTLDPAEYSQPWTVLGASLQLAARLSLVELRAQFGLGAPLTRDTFRFEPGPTVHQVSAVTISTSLAAGLSFP
jgi:hypothetical protein